MARALRAWAINRGGKNSVRNLRYGPRTRLVRGIYPTRARRIIVKYTKDSTSFPGSKMRDPGNEVVKDFVEEEKRQMLDKFS